MFHISNFFGTAINVRPSRRRGKTSTRMLLAMPGNLCAANLRNEKIFSVVIWALSRRRIDRVVSRSFELQQLSIMQTFFTLALLYS
jgi:hypothetical protein